MIRIIKNKRNGLADLEATICDQKRVSGRLQSLHA